MTGPVRTEAARMAEDDRLDARIAADMAEDRQIDTSRWTPEDHSRDQMMAYIIEHRERGNC